MPDAHTRLLACHVHAVALVVGGIHQDLHLACLSGGRAGWTASSCDRDRPAASGDAESRAVTLVNMACGSILVTVATTLTPCCSSASSFAARRKNRQARPNSPTKKMIPGSTICKPPLETSPFQSSRRCEGSVSNIHQQKYQGGYVEARPVLLPVRGESSSLEGLAARIVLHRNQQQNQPSERIEHEKAQRRSQRGTHKKNIEIGNGVSGGTGSTDSCNILATCSTITTAESDRWQAGRAALNHHATESSPAAGHRPRLPSDRSPLTS